MSKKITLTKEQETFVQTNYRKMETRDIQKALSLSAYKMYAVLRNIGIVKQKHRLTDEAKNFIRKNYKVMAEPEMAKRLGLRSRYVIQRFKSEEGLVKYFGNRNKSYDDPIQSKRSPVPEKRSMPLVMEMNGFFNVDAHENWVA